MAPGWTKHLSFEPLEDILGCFGQRGALPGMIVCPAAARIAGRPRYGNDLSPLFERQPRRNKRPRFEGRFHHQYAGRQAGNDPVAGRRVSCRRLRSDGLIRYHGPCLADTGLQFRVFGRLDEIDPARDSSNGPGCVCAQMRRAVNSAGEPRHDYIARVPEIGGHFLRKPLSVGRCVAGAHDGDRRVIQQSAIAFHEKGRRRVGDCRRCRRIVRVGERDHAPAGSVQPAQFGADVRFWWRDKSALAPRALRYFRQFGDGCRGRS